jgi:hypothetical protein
VSDAVTRRLRHGVPPTAASQRIAAIALALASLGTVCAPQAIRVANRPLDPVLVDAGGAVERSGVDALIAEVERARGLGFVQHPALELLSVDDARLPALLAAARALEACPRAMAAPPRPADAAGRCFPDPSLEWIDCVAPPDLDEARRALRRLLDAQNYPRLARVAPSLPGDPGVALRALLAASANGASAPPGATGDALDLFDLPSIELERADGATDGCVAIAEHFLSAESDREAPFRNPPRSTAQLVSPKRWRAGERPVVLAGAPPPIAGCRVAEDASVGVARLLVALLATGGSLPGSTLGAWQGDRGVRFACDAGPERWIYVAELADRERAAAFAGALARLLPPEFARPFAAQAVGRRVVASDGVVDLPLARAWAVALASGPLP